MQYPTIFRGFPLCTGTPIAMLLMVAFPTVQATTICQSATVAHPTIPLAATPTTVFTLSRLSFSGTGTGVERCLNDVVCTQGPEDNTPSYARIYSGSLPAEQENRRLHWMRFKLHSGSYFWQNPSAHLTIGMRGIGTPIAADGNGPRLIGSGMTLGTVGGACGVSSNQRALAIEQYGDGSLTYPYQIAPGSCQLNALQDGAYYTVELYVHQENEQRWIAYHVKDAWHTVIASRVFHDPTPCQDMGNRTGWWIGHVDNSAGKRWAFDIVDLEIGVQ